MLETLDQASGPFFPTVGSKSELINKSKTEPLPFEISCLIFKFYSRNRPFGQSVPTFSFVCKEWAHIADVSYQKIALKYFNLHHCPKQIGNNKTLLIEK